MKIFSKTLLVSCFLALLLALQSAFAAEEKAAQDKKEEDVNVSDLEEDYWRPNRDELEVIQNRRFDKKGRFELGLGYGIYQGGDYLNSRSLGASLSYHWNNAWATEVSALKVNNKNSDFLTSVQQRYGFSPDFNAIQSEYSAAMLWTPIYAKFSFLGKKISHFETYLGPGIGVTNTTATHFTKIFQIGEKFFITDHCIFRIEWKISQFTDNVIATQGAPSKANGGPGFFDQSVTRNNIIFGFGWLF